MAEVLAEQGDLASAAEIYDELVLAAPEGERDALCRRRDELKAAYEPILGNFSFALMLSCIGMMVIFGVIMFFNLKG